MEEVVIDGVTVVPEVRMPDLRPDEEMFPHVVDVEPSEEDMRAADSVDAIATQVENLVKDRDLTGPAARDALIGLAGDPFFQQLIGLAEKAAA